MKLNEALKYVQSGEYIGRKERGCDFRLAIGSYTKEAFWKTHNTGFCEDLNVDDAIADDYYLLEPKNTKTVSHESILSGLDIAPSIKNNLLKVTP